MPNPSTAINESKLDEFLGRAMADIGAALSAALVVIGDRLGLYRAMAGAGPVTPAELARRTETAERYVREWLANQAAGGYIAYDPATRRYSLPPEQAAALADETSRSFLPAAFQIVTAAMKAEARVAESFRTGAGLDWCDSDAALLADRERLLHAAGGSRLAARIIPALDGVEAKLRSGARVADVGCGHGASTILMAEAFPSSLFVGFDQRQEAIASARRRARQAGLENRVRFDVARAHDFPGSGYDLVTCFDCLHHIADPGGAARHIRRALASDGTWLVLESRAHDRIEENLNAVGRVYYGASTMLCAPCALAANGPALGAQAGEARLQRIVVTEGGFTRLRRALETPFDLVLEARP